MSGWHLTLKAAPALRLDLRGLSQLAGLGAADIERLPLPHGAGTLPLAECFTVRPAGADGDLRLEGDLARCDRIAWGWAAGTLTVHGAAGHYLAAGMSGGRVDLHGDAGDLAACEMAGGALHVHGSLGDLAASNLPGSMDGMRGGLVHVRGSVGTRCGDRMRRGLLLVEGDAGDFLASRLVAGTLAVAGRCGAHPGYGMRRGSLFFTGSAPELPVTFLPAGGEVPVAWHLLASDIARHGGPFAGMPARPHARWVGDVGVAGKGEVWVVGR